MKLVSEQLMMKMMMNISMVIGDSCMLFIVKFCCVCVYVFSRLLVLVFQISVNSGSDSMISVKLISIGSSLLCVDWLLFLVMIYRLVVKFCRMMISLISVSVMIEVYRIVLFVVIQFVVVSSGVISVIIWLMMLRNVMMWIW